MIKNNRVGIFVFFFLFSSCVTLGSPSAIEFGDSHLKSIIEETLKKKDPNTIDILGLESLEVPWATIRSIKGLEMALNLKKLDVENNSICCLEPIKNLRHIEELDISGCGTSDSDNLANIKSLKILKASRNQFSNISFLENLMNLEELDLSDNNIADIEPLGVLTDLRGLSLDNNMISDISVLAKLKKLKGLTCFGNQIRDITDLSQLYKMENLELGRNEIENIEALSELSQLVGLGLTGNKIKNILPLSQLKKLELLELGENSIVDVSPLSDLTELGYLALQRNMIKDISGIDALTKIEVLNLNGNPLDYDSLEFSLPLLFLRKPEEIKIYWSGRKYETDDRELRGKEPIQYSIGPYAEMSPDERYLTIVIGPRHPFLPVPDETASVYLLDTESKNAQLSHIPYTTGIKFHFGQYPIAWRRSTASLELYVFTDWFVPSLETPCLKGF